MNRGELIAVAALLAGLAACAGDIPPEPFATITANWVPAALETPPVGSEEDAADDPAIWVHPDDPAGSLVLGTDKSAGLHVYDLAGRERQFLPSGNVNNVDLRRRPWGERDLSIAVASHRRPSEVVVFTIDHASRTVDEVRRIPVALTAPYGICLYQDPQQQPWVVLNDKDGTFVQYRLERDYRLTEARRFRTATQPEGCVVDDDAGMLYIGEEAYGVWRLTADPGGSAELESFAAIADGNMTADVEGLALYQRNEQSYLVVSSQGDNSYALFDTGSNAFLTSFHIGRHPEIDDVSETDGLAVTAAPLPGFPDGLLVVQDGHNLRPVARQNFKYVSWSEVAGLLDDPR